MTSVLAVAAHQARAALALSRDGHDAALLMVRDEDDEGLREAVLKLQCLVNAAQALQADALAEIARRARAEDKAALKRDGFLHHSQEEFVVDEMGLILSTTKTSASVLYERAVRTGRCPSVMQAWRLGTIDARKAEAIAGTHELCRQTLPSKPLELLMTSAIEHAGDHTLPQLRDWLRRREIAADPTAAERRRQAALLERRVVVRPAGDGMSELWATLPSLGARAIQQALDLVAREAGAVDPRTMDQRRADALIELVTGEAEPRATQLHVVVPADVLGGTSDKPGWLPGVGPITAAQARQLAGTGADPDSATVIRRLVTDPVSGTLVDLTEDRYRPSGALERAVRARDMTCRFPGCRRSAIGPSSGTDLDHTVPWPEGKTSAGNLAALCRRHHRLKHMPGWKVIMQADGTMTWTTPTGRTFTSHPWCHGNPGDSGRAPPDPG
jgi:hypothetical protein